MSNGARLQPDTGLHGHRIQVGAGNRVLVTGPRRAPPRPDQVARYAPHPATAPPAVSKEPDDRPGSPGRLFSCHRFGSLKRGCSSKVLIALVLQLCGHIPGVIYGIYVVTQE
jgi:hypothetical protein